PEEEVHARHILISAGVPNPFGPPKAPREQAREAIEQEKAKKLLEEITSHSHVQVAENYKVTAPPNIPSMAPQPQTPSAPPASSPGNPAAGSSPAAKPAATKR